MKKFLTQEVFQLQKDHMSENKEEGRFITVDHLISWIHANENCTKAAKRKDTHLQKKINQSKFQNGAL